MKEFKRRRNIERATAFKVQYACYLGDTVTVEERTFTNIKSMRQWIERNDNENNIGLFVAKTLALIYGEWEPFTTIGKKTITLSDLETIIKDMREDFNPSKTEN